MNITEFEQLIGQLMNPNNNLRDQAEGVFHQLKKNPDFLISSLIQLIGVSQSEEVRSLSSILLRRVLSKGNESLWPVVSIQTQEVVKAQLISFVENEKSEGVRSKLTDCLAFVGSIILEKNEGQWNELLPFMYKLSKNPNPYQREASFEIFSHLASQIGEKLLQYFQVLKEVVASGLRDPIISVRVAALEAAANFLHALQKQEKSEFQELIPFMFDVINGALTSNNEDQARSALEVFVDLAEIDPLFLKPSLSNIIPGMMLISSSTKLEDETKHLGLEFLVTLTESKPSMMRKFPKFLEEIIPIVLNMMLDIEETEEWNTKTNEEEDDVDISNSDIGEESLDRLALSIGGKAMVPAVFALLPVMLSNQDWRYRHAGLLSISIIGEGCNKFLVPHLPEVVKNIFPFFSDPHPRVRWAVCNTVGQMSTDFGPQFQKLFHAEVLPALATVMDDKENPRVQSHAASALINFCEHCSATLIGPYLDLLMSKLFSLLQINKTIVQEQAITAIAAIADCAEDKFHKYYDSLMPFLKNILVNANGKEYRMLRGKTMECASLIGIAVGKERFFKDAKDIMDLMMKTQTSKLEADDPQVGFLLQSWARICRCLGEDFVPYLPHIMPPLLASAKISPNIKIDSNETAEEGWDFIPVGDKKIAIHTSSLEEKSTACNMIYCYASELKEGFFSFC